MLDIQHLKKRFGSTVAVDDISFSVDKGSCFGLLGPNGAGKSTTISILVGALKADSGSVLIEGKPVASETDPVRRRIGYVPQEIALYEDLTALDNMHFFGALYGAIEPARITEALTIVGLQDRSKEPVRNFSGGMKRRLNIAVALVHSPDLLVLDEPTVGVDPQSRNAIFESLEHLRSTGITLLYITHYMEEVERLCDRIAIIDHGKIVANDNLEGLLSLLPTRTSVKLTFADENTAEQAEAVVKEIATASRLGATVTFTSKDLVEGLAAATGSLRAAGLEVTAVSTNRPTLEEVFLHCTGRSLRDQ